METEFKHNYMESESLISEINVDKVNIQQDDEAVLIVTLLESKGNQNCIMFQFQSVLSKQDIKLGWTKYYISACDSGVGNYNCVSNIDFLGNEIELKFNQIGIDTFGLEIIRLKITKEEIVKVRKILLERFRDEDSVKVIEN